MSEKFLTTKQIKFSAAHRLLNYVGDCANIHGHNYVAEITFSSTCIPKSSGMVIDFKEIKKSVGTWIMKNWDHSLVIHKDDNFLIEFARGQRMKFYVMREGNPTAENMCKEIKSLLQTMKFDGVDSLYSPKRNAIFEKVKIWETDSSYAEII